MKRDLTLTITSLLSILLVTFHMTDDTLHATAGTPEAAGVTLYLMPLLVVWLYGLLELAESRWRYILLLIFSALGAVLPVFHMMGPLGVLGSGGIGRGYIFAWTLHAIIVTSMFSFVLAARGLWRLRSGPPR